MCPGFQTSWNAWRFFFNSPAGSDIDPKVRILFALAGNDGKTVPIWQQVLGALKKKNGSIPFELYWKEVGSFTQNPEWESVDSFRLLEPAVLSQPKVSPAEENTIDPVATVPSFYQAYSGGYDRIEYGDGHHGIRDRETGRGGKGKPLSVLPNDGGDLRWFPLSGWTSRARISLSSDFHDAAVPIPAHASKQAVA